MSTPQKPPVLSAIAAVTRPIYSIAGGAAVALLVAIALLTLLQILARPLAIQVRGLSDLAAYATAGVTFLGLPYTFRTGGVIRVELLLERLSQQWQRRTDIACLVISLVVMIWSTYASVQMLFTSIQLGEAALFLPFPLWIAQVPMVAGLAIMTLAVAETLFERMVGIALENADLAAQEEYKKVVSE